MIAHPYPPVVDAGCRTLVLGSFPSVKSRENGFFYGHPQNRFWRVLAAVWNAPPPQSVEEKTALLLAHGVALWDVIAACDVVGSGDASIRNVVPVDIRRVTDVCRITRVFANGQLSGRLYRRYLEATVGLPATVLPSTSPANAACSLPRLAEAWACLRDT